MRSLYSMSMQSHVDLNQVIASKSPKLERRMPYFLKRYLQRILHVDQINKFLEENHDKQGMAFTHAVMDFIQLKVEVTGMEHFRGNTAPVFAANHPLGGLDGIALLDLAATHYGAVKTAANDFLMALDTMQEFFIPVNKLGSNREYQYIIREAYESDVPIVIFPAGICSRKLPIGIFDVEWQKSFIKLARSNGRPIVPLRISGRNSHFFYNLAKLRRFLHIKFNIEMLYLVDELFKQQNCSLQVIVGPPIPSEQFDSRCDDWTWARKLRQYVYYLSSENYTVPFDPDAPAELPVTYFG